MITPTDQRARRSRQTWAAVVLIAFAVLMLYAVYRPIRSDIVWMTDFEAARKAALEQDKPILLYFTGDWCPPCRRMARWTWPDDQVEELVMSSFIPLEVDLPNPDTLDPLAVRYNVYAFPTIIVTNADGVPLGVLPGYVAPSELMKLLTPAHAEE